MCRAVKIVQLKILKVKDKVVTKNNKIMAWNLMLSRSLARQCLLGKNSASVTAFSRKTLMLSPVQCKRIYGPQADHEKQDEVGHWKREHYAAIALLPIIPAALAYPNPLLDMLLVSAMTLHVHWRLSGVAGDYIHGAIMPKIAKPVVLLISITALGCLCYFNYFDVGFSQAVRMLYSQL